MAKAHIDELWWARVAKQEGLHVGKYYRQYHQRRRTVEEELEAFSKNILQYMGDEIGN